MRRDISDEELLAESRKLLIQHFNAKDPEVAKPSDYIVTYTANHQWILSPKSAVSKTRKVITQL